MKVLKVKTKPPYDIVIGSNIFPFIAEDLARSLDFGKIALITDTKVERYYGEEFLEHLKRANIKVELFSFPEGESSKNMETVLSLARALVQKGYDRKDLIIALGGGVVGDIAGFLASIYLRGIAYVQIPTTLLAQVDSSIGGKTGVDLPEGKNLLGTFYQPRRVYIDTKVLKTLPLLEIKNGLAEIIKYGCILRKAIFQYLSKRASTIYDLERGYFPYLIYQSCATKAYVVTRDERESGLRRVLNFGHTLGHALETLSNYSVPHGLAVAVGMALESKLSELLKVNIEPVFDPLIGLLTRLQMPYRISHLNLSLDPSQIMNLLAKDKKVWKGKLTIVLLKKIGEFTFYESPPVSLVEKAVEELS